MQEVVTNLGRRGGEEGLAWPSRPKVGSKSGSKSGQSQAKSQRPRPSGLASLGLFIGFKRAKGQISRPSTLPFPSFMFFLLGPDSQVLIVDMYKSLSLVVTVKSAPYRSCTADILQKRVLAGAGLQCDMACTADRWHGKTRAL
jgi:hypothetical protein